MKYSGKDIIKAGEKLIDPATIKNEKEFSDVMDVISFWRGCHEIPLENALSLLKDITLTKDKSAIFAKRLKRYTSIFEKLKRFEKMKLKNMQDIGGCRAIVATEKKLTQVVRDLKKNSVFKNSDGKIREKNYIKNPKDDGYRGYHLIGSFSDNNRYNRKIEIQVRTALQHDWATALEIVDIFTGQALKSNQGRKDWSLFFKNVSDVFAIMDSIHMFNSKNDNEKITELSKKLVGNKDSIKSCEEVKKLQGRLSVIRRLAAYASSLKFMDQNPNICNHKGYVLIQVDVTKMEGELQVFSVNSNNQALKEYAKKEKKAAKKENIVVALVYSTAIGGIKEAYPNYFADSSEFSKLLKIIVDVNLSSIKKM